MNEFLFIAVTAVDFNGASVDERVANTETLCILYPMFHR